MSKNISSLQIHSVSVADVFGDKVILNTYTPYDISSEQENIDMFKEGITLFADATARTNVIIRDHSGRFLSYKNVPDLRSSVESLKPFPVVGQTVGV